MFPIIVSVPTAPVANVSAQVPFGALPSRDSLPLVDGTTLNGMEVTALCVDRAGTLWVGTEADGLWRYDFRKRQWTSVALPDTPSEAASKDSASKQITALLCDGQGRVWIGTAMRGLVVFNGTAWQSYDRLSGPLGSHVFALAQPPGAGAVPPHFLQVRAGPVSPGPGDHPPP